MLLLLYVDDIILTGNHSSQLASFVSTLGQKFELSDLGPLSYFLGLEATSSPAGLRLTQLKYTLDLLKKFSMSDCKPCSTPVCVKKQLSATDGDLLTDATEYRQLVGSLQYLTFTRPDIAYAVHHVAQFMSNPRSSHLLAAKRILRYLKGTVGFGLFYRRSSPSLTIRGYSDADWAGCPDTRRSTTGFCVFLGPNLISWTDKKQPTVSLSSAKAEYRSLAYVCAESTWSIHLLKELQFYT